MVIIFGQQFEISTTVRSFLGCLKASTKTNIVQQWGKKFKMYGYPNHLTYICKKEPGFSASWFLPSLWSKFSIFFQNHFIIRQLSGPLITTICISKGRKNYFWFIIFGQQFEIPTRVQSFLGCLDRKWKELFTIV